jgi:hypothetical protein
VKLSDFHAAAKCAACSRPVWHAGVPLFWRVRVERLGIDARAIQRETALGSFLNSPALAKVMGTDQDVTMPMMEPKTISLCEPCVMDMPALAMTLMGG